MQNFLSLIFGRNLLIFKNIIEKYDRYLLKESTDEISGISVNFFERNSEI